MIFLWIFHLSWALRQWLLPWKEMRGCRKDTGVKVRGGFQVHAQFRFILVKGNHKGINQQCICRSRTNHSYKKKSSKLLHVVSQSQERNSIKRQSDIENQTGSPVPQSLLCCVKLWAREMSVLISWTKNEQKKKKIAQKDHVYHSLVFWWSD